MNGQDYRLRSRFSSLKARVKELEDRQIYDIEARAELLLHLSKISRLEGQVISLLEEVRSQSKRIQELTLHNSLI